MCMRVIQTGLHVVKSGYSPWVCNRKYCVWLHVLETLFPENGHVKLVETCRSNDTLLSV